MKINLKNNINIILITLLACIFAISLDIIMKSIESHYGIGECQIYRNDQQEYNLYEKN